MRGVLLCPVGLHRKAVEHTRDAGDARHDLSRELPRVHVLDHAAQRDHVPSDFDLEMMSVELRHRGQRGVDPGLELSIDSHALTARSLHADSVMEPENVESRQVFLQEIADRVTLPRDITPEVAVSATMGNLVARLTAGEAHNVLYALPDAVGELLARVVSAREGIPVDTFGRAQFLERVAEDLGVTPVYAEAICRVVFDAVEARLPPEEIDHVANQLPHGLKELWLEHGAIQQQVPADAEAARDEALAYVAEHGGLPDDVSPEQAVATVLSRFSARLSGGEAIELFLAIPDRLRVLFSRAVLHRAEEAETFDRDELLRRVAGDLGAEIEQAEPITSAVFKAVQRVIPRHAIDDVASQLPEDLRSLWRPH